MRGSCATLLLGALLLAACASPAASPDSGTSPSAAQIPTPPATSPFPSPRTDPGGSPVLSRADVALAGAFGEDVSPWPGWGAAPGIPIEVTVTGLQPDEPVSLAASADYDVGVLGCGRQPDPCFVGTGRMIDDPGPPQCEPGYSEHATGSASGAVGTVAGADGSAAATIWLVIAQASKLCPLDPALPWYQQSAAWSNISMTDASHGLRIALPDWIIGP